MLPWTPFALQHHSYIGLDRAGERKKGNLGCKTNQVVPITEHLLATTLAARKLIDLDPNKTEHGEGIFRGSRGEAPNRAGVVQPDLSNPRRLRLSSVVDLRQYVRPTKLPHSSYYVR